jgi:hypothetical protein
MRGAVGLQSGPRTNKVVAWASGVAGYAPQLPSKQARDDYLRERGRELVTRQTAERLAVELT